MNPLTILLLVLLFRFLRLFLFFIGRVGIASLAVKIPPMLVVLKDEKLNDESYALLYSSLLYSVAPSFLLLHYTALHYRACARPPLSRRPAGTSWRRTRIRPSLSSPRPEPVRPPSHTFVLYASFLTHTKREEPYILIDRSRSETTASPVSP